MKCCRILTNGIYANCMSILFIAYYILLILANKLIVINNIMRKVWRKLYMSWKYLYHICVQYLDQRCLH